MHAYARARWRCLVAPALVGARARAPVHPLPNRMHGRGWLLGHVHVRVHVHVHVHVRVRVRVHVGAHVPPLPNNMHGWGACLGGWHLNPQPPPSSSIPKP